MCCPNDTHLALFVHFRKPASCYLQRELILTFFLNCCCSNNSVVFKNLINFLHVPGCCLEVVQNHSYSYVHGTAHVTSHLSQSWDLDSVLGGWTWDMPPCPWGMVLGLCSPKKTFLISALFMAQPSSAKVLANLKVATQTSLPSSVQLCR